MGKTSGNIFQIRAVWVPRIPDDSDDAFVAVIRAKLDDSYKIIGSPLITYSTYVEDDEGNYVTETYDGKLDRRTRRFDFGDDFDSDLDQYMPTNILKKKIVVGELFNLTDGREESVFRIVDVRKL